MSFSAIFISKLELLLITLGGRTCGFS
jgi:hypothetical protein